MVYGSRYALIIGFPTLLKLIGFYLTNALFISFEVIFLPQDVMNLSWRILITASSGLGLLFILP